MDNKKDEKRKPDEGESADAKPLKKSKVDGPRVTKVHGGSKEFMGVKVLHGLTFEFEGGDKRGTVLSREGESSSWSLQPGEFIDKVDGFHCNNFGSAMEPINLKGLAFSINLHVQPTDRVIEISGKEEWAKDRAFSYEAGFKKEIVEVLFAKSGGLQSTGVATRDLGGIIQLEILGVKDILASDLLGKSDPYIQVFVGERQLFQTTTKMFTLNAVFKESCSFEVGSGQENIELRLYDRDLLKKDDYLGTATICMEQLGRPTARKIHKQQLCPVWHDMWLDFEPDEKCPKAKGKVQVTMTLTEIAQ